MKLTRARLTLVTLLWSVLFAVLAATHFSPFGLLNIVGFPFLLLVPGYLTVLLLNFGGQRGAVKAALSVGFSLFELTLVALAGNFLLPVFGNNHPLEMPVLLTETLLLVAVLLRLLWRQAEKPGRTAVLDVWPPLRFSRLDTFFACAPLLFVGLAILGAVSLNNGGSNAITVGMLIAMVGYLAGIIYYANRLRTNALVIGVFFFGLALLFMTSLRGWYITGHDIQHEFRLLIQTIESDRWSMGIVKDAYNACLSVTLLPTVFYKLLDVDAAYVFKVLFQIIFAFAPVLTFLISYKFVNKRIALLATAYFVSFPTFFTDMPMLNRQEIALIFAGLGLYILFADSISVRIRQSAFMCMALGVVVSHYSTNYTQIALLLCLVLVVPLMGFLAKRLSNKNRLYRLLNLNAWEQRHKKFIVTPFMVIALLLASFTWSVQLTNTSGQLVKVVQDTIAHIQIALGEDSASQDTYFSYNEISKLDDQQKLYRYFEQLSQWAREKSKTGTFYDKSTYAEYEFPIVDDPKLPLTPLGENLAKVGVPVEKLNSLLRNSLAKYVQAMLAVGVFIILFSKRFRENFTPGYRALQLGGVFLMGIMLALPVLLADYDLSRMLQQLLFYASVAIVLGSMYIIPKIAYRTRLALATTAVVIMFSSMSGLLTSLFGGYNAQLHLSNSGIYYNLYYTHVEERIAAKWLNDILERQHLDNIQTDNVFVDRYTNVKVQSVMQLNLLNDIYPGLVRKNSYVFLGYTTVTQQQATAYYNGVLISYKYPMKFLDDNKDLIYNNGGSRVYR